MENLLILLKLLGVACVGAGAALLGARVLRVDRWFAWLSRRDIKPWRLAIASAAMLALGSGAAITMGMIPADFSRLSVGLGLWFMIAAPMMAWPILLSGREPASQANPAAIPLPHAAHEAEPTRRAA